jgi:hypothetical protein
MRRVHREPYELLSEERNEMNEQRFAERGR